jgi:serine/threonine protein kinase
MDILNAILQGVAAAVGRGAVSVGQRVVAAIRERWRNAHARDVLAQLQSLGCVNEGAIRQLVENWPEGKDLTKDQREELITLLTNLVRNARFHTTCGTPLSAFLRCEQLIDQLLSNLQPCRRTAEPVGPGWVEWKLERFLGMGAFGEVWLGRSSLFPEPRAFKFFTREGAGEWLKKEQQALFQVRNRLRGHPNIIEFDNVVLGGVKWPFLVLEYVGGGSLEDWIVNPDRPSLDVREVVAGIARGLSKAHGEHIYHRDLKPANILLTEGPDVLAKIADFGLGLVEQELGATASVHSSQAVIVGTRMYLPPEAADPYAERRPAQDDVFAFGVIWYQLLVGRLERPPYDFLDELRNHGVESATIELIDRCLAHPSRRFEDAIDLADAMESDLPRSWHVPEGCFDVGPLAREYLHIQKQ